MASSSLSESVPLSVQELVKAPVVTVPHCFISESSEEPSLLHRENPMPSIPVIDMASLISGESMEDELLKLHSACKEWGIFQLVNPGVSSSLVEKLKQEIEEFYKLPVEERMKYQVRPGELEGYGRFIIQSSDEERVDWADRFYMMVNPLHIRKPHLLPQLPSSLRETLESYIQETQKLAMDMLKWMAKNLGIEKEEMSGIFDDGFQSMRMTYYPPCPQPDRVIGLRPHSDGSGITILLQVNGVGGFQVKKDGVWLPVDILPNALVVNVGDALEMFSNGIYKSIEHKVTINSSKERISVAMFFNPNMDAEIGPSPSLISKGNSPVYKSLTMKNYVKEFFSRSLNSKSFLEKMKIENENVQIC